MHIRALIAGAAALMTASCGAAEEDAPASSPRDRALAASTADQAFTCAGALVDADGRRIASGNARMVTPWRIEVVATTPHLQVRCDVTTDRGPGTVTASQICADEDDLSCTRLDRLTVGGRVVFPAS